MADTDRIGQVLTNLLDNALRHTPPGGTVTMTCSRLDRWIQYMADNGEGIAGEHLDHVFDRFYSADSPRDRHHGGSGIGLSIAKAHVEAHSGGIAVTSAGLGMGATVTVQPTAADED